MRFILFLSVALSYSISTVLAEESRQVDKHEHGVGELNIAIDGLLAEFEFMLPGADIVGFEYEAKSDEDLAKIENALLVLENYENLFSLTKNSKCVLADLDYHLSGEEHEEHADEEHEEHADEEHEEHADEESHTEFYAKYSFKCDDIKQLDKVEFSYFKNFPNSSELEVQFISDIGSNAFEVEADKPVIILKGLL